MNAEQTVTYVTIEKVENGYILTTVTPQEGSLSDKEVFVLPNEVKLYKAVKNLFPKS